MEWLIGTAGGALVGLFVRDVYQWVREGLQGNQRAAPAKDPVPAPGSPLKQKHLKQMTAAQLQRRMHAAEDRIARCENVIRLEERELKKCQRERKTRAA